MKLPSGASESRHQTLLAPLASLLLVIGCNPGPPKGQVIAVVNGAEITIAELNEEFRARNIAGANNPIARSVLLQDMIDRKLLVQTAIRRKLDRSRQYLIASQRLKEVLLAEQFLSSIDVTSLAPPSTETQAYPISGATMNQRRIFTVDQITFPRFTSSDILERLQKANTISEIEGILSKAALPSQRLVKSWDSAVLPPNLIERLLETKPGRPFLLPYGDVLIAGQVLSSVDQPMEAKQRLRLANDLMTGERRAAMLRRLLKSSRADSRISYQPGFVPPAK